MDFEVSFDFQFDIEFDFDMELDIEFDLERNTTFEVPELAGGLLQQIYEILRKS